MKHSHLALAMLLVPWMACGGHASANMPVVATGERNAKLEKDQGAVLGLVRDASDGLPLSMVSVQAELDGKIIAHDVSDYKGRYRLGPLPPGHYKVTAHFAAARINYEGIVVHEKLETEVMIAIDLRPQGDRATTVMTEGEFGGIEGVVLDSVDGNTFPGSVVSLTGGHLDDAIMSIADENGSFRFRSLRPGVYVLSCYYHLVEQGNIELRRGNIVVAPGETTTVQMQMDLKIR